MIYFIILFLLLFCIYYFDYAKHKRLFNPTYWAFCVILVAVAGLRYRIGNDSIVYENYYAHFPTLPELFSFNFRSIRYEPGFIIFASIPRTITSDFTLLQFFEAAVVQVVISWFIVKNTKNRFLCLTIYYVVMYLYLTTEILREALAMSCFLLAWPYFRDGKWIKYYLLTLLATTFHTSAILLLLLPLFWLPGIRGIFMLGKKTIIIGAGIFLLALFVQLKFYHFIDFIAITQRMSDRADAYSKVGIGGNILNMIGMIDIFIRYALYAILALWVYKNKIKFHKIKGKAKETAKKMEFMVMWQVYIALISMSIFILLRFSNYFCMFTFVMISSIYLGEIDFKGKVYKLRPVYWNLLLLPFFFLNFYWYVRPINKARTIPYYAKYFPYSSRLNPEIDTQREAAFKFYGTK